MGALATIALCLLAAVAGGWAALALAGARKHALEAENSRLRQRAFVLEAQGQAHERGQADVGAKLKYLADASHELRTPVAGIGGLAELLLASDLGPEQASYVQAIGIAGASLSRLVDDILDLARAGAGGMRLAAEPIELARLVEGAAELLAPLAQSKGIEIATLLRPGVPASIVGDGQRLGQVLANLIGNAVKFTEQGGVGVEVAREGDSIRFAVRDTGPGIAPGHRARIFMEYEQVAGAGAGSGLGLPIARRIVRQMGGELALVDSSKGAAFEFSVPHASPSGAREPVAGRPGIAALVVADGPFQGRYICLQLLSAGIAARCLDTVEDACRSLAANTATDVLIADAALGADALARLRAAARHAGVARTILMLSPFERHAAGASPMAGYDGWLTKPVRRQSLFERIAPPARAEAGGAGPRVLLAEDNEISALVATRQLERLEATVSRARDGAAALRMALAAIDGAGTPFDCLFLDIRMPELDGYAVARAIRAAEAARGCPRMRIVALTAQDAASRDEALAAGIDAVLGKNFDLAALARCLPGRAEIRKAS